MPRPLEDLTAALLDAAQKAGADGADAIAVQGTSLSIGVRNGALEEADRAEGTDFGLRVLIGQRQACVASSDASDETIRIMAERAVAMAREAPEDPSTGLAGPEQLASGWDLAALELDDPSADPAPAALQDEAQRMEAAALDCQSIAQVSASQAGYSRRTLQLAATNGFSGSMTRSSKSLSCVAIAGSGTEMERDYYSDSRVYQADLLSPEEIGRTAAERTLARIGAQQPKTGAFPVLFDERVTQSLVGHVLAAINGASVARGASWLRDAMGEQVLPEGIDLIEDPQRPRCIGSRPFDAEGLTARKRALFENGVLQSWVLDLASARKLGLTSTANASRGTSAPPSPSAGNVSLSQGEKSPETLMAEMGTGLLVTSLIGSTINPNTGDYSRGASGLWIENGAPAYPVHECTIAGNLREMLKTMTPSNDARPHLSRVVPSILVEGLTIAGA